jgi:Protein of unknown function (DUF2934)
MLHQQDESHIHRLSLPHALQIGARRSDLKIKIGTRQMESELSDRIRERAYEMWIVSGCREGGAEQDWLFAEREVLSACTLGNSAVVAEVVGDRRASKISKVKSRVRGGNSGSSKPLHSTR